MKTVIHNGKIILKDNILENYNLYFENGKISAITDEKLSYDKSIDAQGAYISPGFIDIHTHGAGGFDFLDGTVDAYVAAAQMHAKFGATSIVPTLTSVDVDSIQKAIGILHEANKTNVNGANLLGFHLEGPYFSQNQKGAQEERFIHPFCKEEYESIIKSAKGSILRWSAAPELEGMENFADFAIKNSVHLSIGHSDAEFDCAMSAYKKGFTHVTHLYSCTSSIIRKNGYRYAGIVEAAYLQDDMTVEIIGDGVHLPAPLLSLVYKIKGPDKIALITDSMRATGMPEGESVLGKLDNGLPVIVEDGVAKLVDRTAFAGSVATMDRVVRNMINLADVPVCDAVKMASLTPAKILNIKNKGVLEVGYDADIIIFDENINIMNTIVNGRVIF